MGTVEAGYNDQDRHGMHNLPMALTAFVGRDQERAKLINRLHDPACRLVTITGPGGIGKTRLALHGASDAVDQGLFPHGVFFVPLAALSARESLDDALATAIADAVGVPLSGSDPPSAQVQRYLREKSVLLVLDNFEHLSAGAAFIATLLQSAPVIKIVVTSRERVLLRGEQIVALEGLFYPADAPRDASTSPEQYSAVQLFVQTAEAIAPDFQLTDATSGAIARICRLVDGMPLGIELAASWTRVLSCAEIADEIARNLDFLTSTAPDLPVRQQSLRAVFAYSWSLLSEPQRQLLRRLSIFRGSFTREAAMEVADASLPVLAALVDQSLVRRVTIGAEAVTRYQLPEVVRQYAAEHLAAAGEDAALARCHALYYVTMLRDLTSALRGSRQQTALALITAEIDEIRAAWHWAVSQPDSAAIAQAADSLFHFYDMRSWFLEGAATFGRAAEALAPQRGNPDAALAWAKARARQGWFTFHSGQQREARHLLEESLEALRAINARAEMVFALNYLAAVCSYLGDDRAMQALCDESLRITDAIGDDYGHAVACNILGQAAYDRGDYVAAQEWSRQSLAIEERIGNRWSMAYSLTTLGKVAYATGDFAEAHRLFEQSLQIREQTGDTRGIAICFNRLGDTAMRLGDFRAAAERYTQSRDLFRDIGNRWGEAASLINLGQLALAQARYATATRLLPEALRLAVETQSAPQARTIIRHFVSLLRAAGESAWADELAQILTEDRASVGDYQPHIARLQSWSWPHDGAMTLEQALADVRDPQPSINQREAAINETQHDPQTAATGDPRGQPTSKVAYPAGLTAREVDVLRLVAQGLTDREVAERLIVSARTVSTHLTSIYGKLQVNSRSAATRFAVEHDLV